MTINPTTTAAAMAYALAAQAGRRAAPGSDGSEGSDSQGPTGQTSTDQRSANPQSADTLSSLASVAGIDPNELLDQINSGREVSGLLSSPGQTGYGSTLADSTTGGLIFDHYA